MSRPLAPVTTIVFDYGNTLIQFTREQIESIDKGLQGFLKERFGPICGDHLRELRRQDRMRPFQGEEPDHRENDMFEMTSNMLATLYQREFAAADVEAVNQYRLEVFVAAIHKPDYLDAVLDQLAARYRLALLSNYPCGASIRESIDRVGIEGRFESIVVSGEVGFVKPHAVPFQTVLDELGVDAHETAYVGDNWLADVQGAARMGMHPVHTRQWETPDLHEASPGDHDATATIHHFKELPEALRTLGE